MSETCQRRDLTKRRVASDPGEGQVVQSGLHGGGVSSGGSMWKRDVGKEAKS